MPIIETLTTDVQKVLEQLSVEHGTFSLAMLYKRDDTSETGWNLIIASSWADRMGKAEATHRVVEALSDGLGLENKRSISRVTVLPGKDAFVRGITSSYQIATPGTGQWVRNIAEAGVPIGTGYIFYSQQG